MYGEKERTQACHFPSGQIWNFPLMQIWNFLSVQNWNFPSVPIWNYPSGQIQEGCQVGIRGRRKTERSHVGRERESGWEVCTLSKWQSATGNVRQVHWIRINEIEISYTGPICALWNAAPDSDATAIRISELGLGASRYDVRKIFWLFDPLPIVRIWIWFILNTYNFPYMSSFPWTLSPLR